MPPLDISSFRLPLSSETMTETLTDIVNNVTTSLVNSTVTSSQTMTSTLPASTFNSEIVAPPDDGDVLRLNTPLSAPQPSLDPVTRVPNSGALLGDTGPEDLGWIIPTAIVCIAAMLGLAFAMYFGIRALELRMLGWCNRNCSCCCRPGGYGRRVLGGERYDTLAEDTGNTRAKESVRLRDFRERSPSYGVSRSTAKEYTPPENPFDD